MRVKCSHCRALLFMTLSLFLTYPTWAQSYTHTHTHLHLVLYSFTAQPLLPLWSVTCWCAICISGCWFLPCAMLISTSVTLLVIWRTRDDKYAQCYSSYLGEKKHIPFASRLNQYAGFCVGECCLGCLSAYLPLLHAKNGFISIIGEMSLAFFPFFFFNLT